MSKAQEAANQKHILLIEDTKALAEMYMTSLEAESYTVSLCHSGGETREFFKNHKNAIDAVLLDFKLPDIDGLDLLTEIQNRFPQVPVIVITGHGSVNTAVNAIRRGAQDFLVKPFSTERLCDALTEALTARQDATMPAALAGETVPNDKEEKSDTKINRNEFDFAGFIGRSTIMQNLYKQIENAARSKATVFITGESGTGKEVCAEAIHKNSNRANQPFIPINCAAIPRDLMESELFGHTKGAFTGAMSEREGAARLADGGTLFLDEIAEMNPDMQTKLLRFLQNLTFQKVGGSKMEKTDIRIICATNRNPLAEVSHGRFREDLFYRLHVLPIYMPPLNMRDHDALIIAHHFLKRFNTEEGKQFTAFSADMERYLLSYAWPGNIRQLQNIIRNIVVMHDATIITPDMLPPDVTHQHDTAFLQPSSLEADDNIHILQKPMSQSDIRPLAETERSVIEEAIKICGGNIPRAAAALGVSPSTLYRKKAGWEQDNPTATNMATEHLLTENS